MLVTGSHNLGDTCLSPEEGLAKAKEDTREMQEAKGMFLAHQDELEDQELAQGTRLVWNEFLRRLTNVAPHLLIREGSPGNLAVYRPKRSYEQDPDEYDQARPAWWNDHKYVTGFPMQALSEFSAVTTTDRGVAKREIRGWRTILIHLIKARAITYRDAVREFGEPTGARSWRWHEQLTNYKGA